jgi:hypothetical protein
MERAQAASDRRGGAMRAIDCAQGHDPIHMTAETDEELMEIVRAHAAEAHPELTDEQMQGMFAQLVHDE